MTKTLGYDTQIWKKKVLVESIDEVVLSPEILELTRQESRESGGDDSYDHNVFTRREVGGFLHGILQKNIFYAFSKEVLAGCGGGAITFEESRLLDALVAENFAKELRNYRTMMYHTHYKLTEEKLWRYFPENAPEITELIQDEISQGIHDHLFTGEINFPSEISPEDRESFLKVYKFNRVLNEVMTRNLSEEDIRNSIGKYHLLISPTLYSNDSCSHLNQYIIKNKKKGLVEKVRIRGSKKEEKSFFDSLNKKYRTILDKSTKEFGLKFFGADITNLNNLTEEQYERASFYLLYGILLKPTNEFKEKKSRKDETSHLELKVA